MPAMTLSQSDSPGSASDLEPRHKAVQAIDEQDHVRRLGRCRRAARAHRDTDICSRQCRRVVHPVSHHHHRTVLPLGKHEQDLLIRRQLRPDAIKIKRFGHCLCNSVPVACRKEDARHAQAPKAR